MHVVTVVFEALPGHETELQHALLVQAAESRSEPGCVRFDVAVDRTVNGRFFLYEIYRRSTDFEAHLRTAHFLSFDKKAGPLTSSKRVDQWTLVK